MALTIETGANIAGANSFATVTEARAWATARGVTLSATDSVVESLLIRAMDYIEAQRDRYQGAKTYSDQTLQFPRTDITVDGIDVPSNTIPKEAKNAQMQLALDVHRGVDLMPTRSGQFVIRDKVGPIETEYSATIGATLQPSLAAADAILNPLLKDTFTGVRVIRA
jgi:hypothetical protein